MTDFHAARQMLGEFKGTNYLFGLGKLTQVGDLVAPLGRRAVLVRDHFPGADRFVQSIRESLAACGTSLAGEVDGARPNAPREDLARITGDLRRLNPDVVVSFGGGSTIDAAKAAILLWNLGGEIDEYFGTGLVSRKLAANGQALTPHVAVQTAASSGAHLTKYSNITDLKSGQKKLVVDEAIVPTRALFDYTLTYGAPAALTADGALDGVAHCLEVLYGAVGKPFYGRMEQIAAAGIRLVVEYLPRAMQNLEDQEAREALGLATDLGGYAIMLGGTNGAHLTSFSLIDILSHGRACAIMNPYYTVFFAPAIQEPLRLVGKVLAQAGYTDMPVDRLDGRARGVAVAQALMALERRIGFPATLGQVPGFTAAHIERALAAAKDPQLKMKLENMPVPLTAPQIDEYMGSVLRAAVDGDLSLVKTLG